ncbi:MAG: heparinase II/III family protein [Syntrophobacteraceae bacterium]
MPQHMNIDAFLLYLRTLASLRPRQVIFRGWNIIGKRPARFSRFQIPADWQWAPLKTSAPFASYAWLNSSEIAAGRFNFLNEAIDFQGRIDWRPANASRLWRYNLHYFNFLNCGDRLDSQAGIGLIEDWIRHNPPGSPDAWDPFPISLRLVNWIKYLNHVYPDTMVPRQITGSIYLQARWLERSLEYHLLGNHLFKNAKALIFCAMFHEGPDAERLLAKGLRILDEELAEQVLADGGHFERSPMYHCMVLEDCLDLLNVCVRDPNPKLKDLSCRLRQAICAMMRFLSGMVHPDGQIALFNDSAFGIELSPHQLGGYYERLLSEQPAPQPGSSWSYPESGYFVMAPREADRLIIDCGRIGPDYQPGHAHCDLLSFELSLNGRRVIVDSGCSQYEDGEIRRYNRGNVGHNTIAIDGENQSEVWGAHRCARRARPLYAGLKSGSDGTLTFEGAHDGYRRLRGSPVHHRRILWSGGVCTIEDKIEGSGSHEIESRLHIHPALSVDLDDDGAIIRHNEELVAHICLNGYGRIEKAGGWYCPEFGIKKTCDVLRVFCPKVSLPFRTGWLIRIPEQDRQALHWNN